MEKRETQADHNRAGEECVSFINQTARESKCVCVCLTVDVVDGESIGEVGHVGLLSEGSFLLRGLLWATIIQTLDRHKKEKMNVCHCVCGTPLSHFCMFASWYSVSVF